MKSWYLPRKSERGIQLNLLVNSQQDSIHPQCFGNFVHQESSIWTLDQVSGYLKIFSCSYRVNRSLEKQKCFSLSHIQNMWKKPCHECCLTYPTASTFVNSWPSGSAVPLQVGEDKTLWGMLHWMEMIYGVWSNFLPPPRCNREWLLSQCWEWVVASPSLAFSQQWLQPRAALLLLGGGTSRGWLLKLCMPFGGSCNSRNPFDWRDNGSF